MPVELLTAQDADWNLERGAFNVLIDQQPAGIALPRSADEVSDVVRAAAADGRHVAAQRTGHLAAPLGPLTDTVLLRTASLDGVEIDADAGTARIGAGALWGDLVPRASELGLAALHGSSPGVGIVGYTLGGGVSFYARKHGLASDRVTAFELVTADGQQIRVDVDNEPDLFWALPGGGGSFGVVTALEFGLLPLREIYAGALFFPAEQASDVLHGWHEWTSGVPDEMTSVGRLMNFPPIPEIPEPVRGKSFTVVEAIYCGDPADGEGLVEPLRQLGTAVIDTMAAQPPAGIADLHMDPPEPVPYWADSIVTEELPAAAIDSLLEAVGPGSGSQLLLVDLRHTGGALSRTPEDAGALARLPGSFLAFGAGFVTTPEALAPIRAWLGAFKAALAPYDAGMYLNFAEERLEMTKAFLPETVDRLREVKRRYDPEDLFKSNHPVTG
ncbi:MAG TPA: FAD-binding oxidoreductase [Propionibacteriaceae bacterium]|nr:FAD-binding oxidoreductase [Propionibacteriaceae bacterium]